MHLPNIIDKSENLAMAKKNSSAVIDLHKEFIAAQYDILFGDGTFKKIYKEYPDVFALDKALESVGVAVNDRLVELEEERVGIVDSMKAEYLSKKEQKK